ncbi:MAG: HAD-IB family hydrolase [Bacteroidetes bacterium]|nr:MAG: HAD-IB family hydrolase [Bacteroidota bacterium]
MDNLLNDPKFQESLIEISEKTGTPLMDLQAKALEYLDELHTEHQPVANILGTQMAQYILSRGYEKTIDVNTSEIKALTKLARRHPIAFVMTHKTYIDMFVLAVVLVRHGLPLPYTFAGINMSFLGVGQFGRQTGVIFIRRNIQKDPVYRATLRHYIAHLVKQRGHFMWAIEGTRSRTGKLVWPKMGILKYIKAAEQYADVEVKYVPVSIVYDLIPDVRDMTEELRGKMKAPESLTWFLNYVRKMGDKFGRISLRIGEPVEMKDWSASDIHQVSQIKNPDGRIISRFALELVHRINQITPVTTASLVCITLLSKYALTKKELEGYVSILMELIESHKPDALVDRGKSIGESVQYALNLLIQARIIRRRGEGVHTKYVISATNYLQATYYANMAVHHLYHQAFIELALLKLAETDTETAPILFWEEIMALRDLFKFEFFYSRKERFTEEIEGNIAFIAPDWNQHIHHPKKFFRKLLEKQRMLVAPVVLSTYVEAYRVVGEALRTLDPAKPFRESAFLEDCLFVGEELQWRGLIQRLESISRPFLKNGIRLVQNLDLLPTPQDPKTEKIAAFIAQMSDLTERVYRLQKITLTKPPEVPVERAVVPGSKTESITNEILSGESGPHIGAFFDLDRTLIQGFSAKEFFQNRLMSGKMTAREVVSQFAGVLIFASGQGNFAGLAAIGAQGVKGIEEKVFVEVGEEVYQKHLANRIYPESRALVAAHLAKRHTVAIISAATPYQVEPVARDLDIEHVMCTRMKVKDGVFTGEIVEPACWGEGKAYAARQLVEQFNLDLSKSYFYTDSAEDLPLLEIVGNPRPINPDTKLSAIAFQNDWPIYRFDDEEDHALTNFARTALALGSILPAVLSGVVGGATHLSWREGVNSMMATVGDLVCAAAGIRLVISGEEHLWSHRPAVFILNHQSSADMFIACKLIRKDARGIAKKELQTMPIIGQLMMASGVIFLDRQNREKAIEALKPAVTALKNGTSIIIFPEGTRSYDYRLGKFKKGAFHIARQARVPIVPIVIKNAHDAMPRGTNVFRPAAVEVKVLPPISTKKWRKKDIDQHIAYIRGLYLKELGQTDPEAERHTENEQPKPGESPKS